MIGRCCVLGLLLLSFASMAVESTVDEAALDKLDFDNVVTDITSSDKPQDEALVRHRIENEFWYVLILAGMLMLSMVIVLWFLKQNRNSSPKDMMNAAGLILIVFGTIILVLIVDTSEQLTAAIGILGAIAGYLFRSAQERVEVNSGEKGDEPNPGSG